MVTLHWLPLRQSPSTKVNQSQPTSTNVNQSQSKSTFQDLVAYGNRGVRAIFVNVLQKKLYVRRGTYPCIQGLAGRSLIAVRVLNWTCCSTPRIPARYPPQMGKKKDQIHVKIKRNNTKLV